LYKVIDIIFILLTLKLGLQYVQVGSANQNQFPPKTEVFDTDTDTSCEVNQSFYDYTSNEDGIAGTYKICSHTLKILKIKNILGTTDGMICDEIFGKGICCNGHFGNQGSRDMINPTCAELGPSGWTPIESMPECLCDAASIPLHNKNMLLVTGGTSNFKLSSLAWFPDFF